MPETDDYNGLRELTVIEDMLAKGSELSCEAEVIRSALQYAAKGLSIEEACERAVEAWEREE